MIITLKKDDSIKLIDENSSLLEVLKASGWEVVTEVKTTKKPKEEA